MPGSAASRSFARTLLRKEWPGLLLSLGFAVAALGHFCTVPPLSWIAGQVMWWWPYELLGTVFLMLYLAVQEGSSEKIVRPRHRLVLLVALFTCLTGALHLMFHLPLQALVVSGLALLPGYVPVLAFGREGERERFLYRGGRAFGSLIVSFFCLALLAALLEGPGVRAGGRAVFEGSIMVLWGAVYFLIKAVLEAANRRAAVALGEGRDPRWGGDG
jgi:hypothetical protein